MHRRKEKLLSGSPQLSSGKVRMGCGMPLRAAMPRTMQEIRKYINEIKSN